MAGQFCSSALQKLDKPGGATMSNFPGRLRRRSGVADNWRDPPGFTRHFSEGAAERWSGSTPDSMDGNAAPGCPGKAESSISRCRSDFLRQRPTNTPPTMPRRRRPDQRRSAHHQREPLPRCERVGQRLQLQDPDTPAQPPFGPQDGTDPDCRRPTHQTSERRISGSKGVRRTASQLQAPGSG